LLNVNENWPQQQQLASRMLRSKWALNACSISAAKRLLTCARHCLLEAAVITPAAAALADMGGASDDGNLQLQGQEEEQSQRYR
jgi:hypothetical protein